MDRRKSLAKNFAVHGKKDGTVVQDSEVFLSELISHRPGEKAEDALTQMQNAAEGRMYETADKMKQDATAEMNANITNLGKSVDGLVPDMPKMPDMGVKVPELSMTMPKAPEMTMP